LDLPQCHVFLNSRFTFPTFRAASLLRGRQLFPRNVSWKVLDRGAPATCHAVMTVN
jgi:hypothetical protein